MTAESTLKTLYPWLQENNTPIPSTGGTVRSFSHDLGGDGPILCAVHGWPQSSYMWRHILPSLRPKISLFIPDLPGYGFSSPPQPTSDKRTVGRILITALQTVFNNNSSGGHPRPIIWCGHDRGGRIGHRLLVDADPTHNLISAILLDIVPTWEQWKVFSHPAASKAYFHWPFLALPGAAEMILAMERGGESFTRVALEKAVGGNAQGREMFARDDAVEGYVRQFGNPECVRGACADYAAAAEEDVAVQTADVEGGRKVEVPVMVVYSSGNLGRMHDVEKAWEGWIKEGTKMRFEGIGEGYGHYLPEEAPEIVERLIAEWIDETTGTKK